MIQSFNHRSIQIEARSVVSLRGEIVVLPTGTEFGLNGADLAALGDAGLVLSEGRGQQQGDGEEGLHLGL